jgi:hypothetical protein
MDGAQKLRRGSSMPLLAAAGRPTIRTVTSFRPAAKPRETASAPFLRKITRP